MKVLIVIASVLAISNAGAIQGLHNNIVYARSPLVHTATSTQYHTQDELGQYSYGYSGGPSSKQETKTADGITRGSYSYIDANGLVQQVNYVSDPVNGFRAAGTNFPTNPAAALPVAVHAAPAPIRTVNYHNTAPAQIVAHQNYAPAPIARLPQVIPRVTTLNYAPAPPQQYVAQAPPQQYIAQAPRQISYAQAPLVRQVSAGFGGPVYAAQLPQPVDDTYEVKAAKAAHFRAYNEALARNRY